MVGYALGAEEATAILRNQDIVFDANATKVFVSFQFVEV